MNQNVLRKQEVISTATLIVFFQVILPLLKSDLFEVVQSTLDGQLCTSLPAWLENHVAVTVVMASKGYPGAYTTGMEITGEYEGRREEWVSR